MVGLVASLIAILAAFIAPFLLSGSSSLFNDLTPNANTHQTSGTFTTGGVTTLTSSASSFESSTATMSSSFRAAAPLVVPAASNHTATVIFMHGLGDSGAGWADAVSHWQRKKRLNEVKFILPNAPTVPVTVNMGMRMPSWFDLKTLGSSANLHEVAKTEDKAGILAAVAHVHSLINDEVSSGIPANRIIIGGFSQGGALALISGLTAPSKIGGIVGLSSWLLLHQTFREHIPAGNPNENTPILMGHGSEDPVVLYPLGELSQKMLNTLGFNVTMKTYESMAHSACLEELDDVEDFIQSKLSKA